MKYVLDSSFFIDAHRLHLPMEHNPDFWNWLLELAQQGVISAPEMVYEEMKDFHDALGAWIRTHKEILVDQEASLTQIRKVMEEGYGDLDEITLETLWADPWLIAHALAVGGTVVTSEKPGNQTNPRKKKIPSVCKTLHVPCCTITSFLWQIRATMPR